MRGFALLNIPKAVTIRNTRLNVLYQFLLVLFVAAYLTYFFVGDKYKMTYDLSKDMSLSVFPVGYADHQSLHSALQTQKSTPLCNITRDGCAPVCTSNSLAGRCAHALELFQVESPTSLFFPTKIHEYGAGASLTSILPYDAAYALDFEYAFLVPTGAGFLGYDERVGRHVVASTKDIQTVLLKDYQIWSRRQPANSRIQLSVRDLLVMASSTDALNSNNHAARMNGIEIDVTISCANFAQHVRKSELLGRAKYTCEVHARRSPRADVIRLLPTGHGTYRLYNGVRVNFLTEGRWKYANIETILKLILDILVLTTVPGKLVKFVATMMLGELSTVYSRVINEPFGIREAVGGMSTRLMASNAAYLDLADIGDEEGNLGISLHRMVERLTAALKFEGDLDDVELKNLATFCFRAAHTYSSRDRATAAMTVWERWTAQPTKDSSNVDNPLLEQQFGDAITNNEKVRFLDIVTLFDKDRSLGFWERIFMPDYLKGLRSKGNITRSHTRGNREPESKPACEVDEPTSAASDMYDLDANSITKSESFFRNYSPNSSLANAHRKMSLEKQKYLQFRLLDVVKELDGQINAMGNEMLEVIDKTNQLQILSEQTEARRDDIKQETSIQKENVSTPLPSDLPMMKEGIESLSQSLHASDATRQESVRRSKRLPDIPSVDILPRFPCNKDAPRDTGNTVRV